MVRSLSNKARKARAEQNAERVEEKLRIYPDLQELLGKFEDAGFSQDDMTNTDVSNLVKHVVDGYALDSKTKAKFNARSPEEQTELKQAAQELFDAYHCFFIVSERSKNPGATKEDALTGFEAEVRKLCDFDLGSTHYNARREMQEILEQGLHKEPERIWHQKAAEIAGIASLAAISAIGERPAIEAGRDEASPLETERPDGRAHEAEPDEPDKRSSGKGDAEPAEPEAARNDDAPGARAAGDEQEQGISSGRKVAAAAAGGAAAVSALTAVKSWRDNVRDSRSQPDRNPDKKGSTFRTVAAVGVTLLSAAVAVAMLRGQGNSGITR